MSADVLSSLMFIGVLMCGIGFIVGRRVGYLEGKVDVLEATKSEQEAK